jgi:hypothetical protein
MTAKKSPTLPPISEQMQAWSAALATELKDWPQSRQVVFFGFTALYRGRAIFGILPRTRCIESKNSIAFRIDAPIRKLRSALDADRRIGSIDRNNTRWFTFEMSSDSDLHDALNWLGSAYTAAARRKRKS